MASTADESEPDPDAPTGEGHEARPIPPPVDTPEDLGTGTRERLERAAAELAGTQEWAHTPSPDAWIGRVLDGRYRIDERLGTGGMGAVFRAEQVMLRKTVAIKVVRSELAGKEDVAHRFAREAMASAQLDHPHVAGAFDYGVLEEGGAYLVMPLVEGRSVRGYLAHEGFAPLEVVCEVGAQVADALAAAHRLGIVHRDLKPENLLLEERSDGSVHVRVVDFGIARLRLDPGGIGGARPDETITRAGTVIGTPGYMAPEQAMADEVDHRADLYSLGVILWELATGEDPFRRRDRDVASLIRAQLLGRIDPPDPARLPPPLEALLRSLMAADRAQRPADAALVRDALRQLGPGAGVSSAPAARSESGRTTAQSLVDSLPSPPRLGSAPTLALALAAFAGALAVGAAIAWLAGSRATGPAPPPEPARVVAAPAPTPRVDAPSAEEARRAAEAAEMAALSPLVRERLLAMTQAEKWVDRQDAAAWIVSEEGQAAEVPAWARAVAGFEVSRGCRDRKEAIEGILAVGDVRGVPALARIGRAPETGCGKKGDRDCHGCIRRDLKRAIRALDPETAAAIEAEAAARAE